jgi:hypothetical protein
MCNALRQQLQRRSHCLGPLAAIMLYLVLFFVFAVQALTPYEQQLAKLEAKYKKNNAKVGGQSVENTG